MIAWEGEKTLTFTVEDALLSPIGFAILSGAGLIKPNAGSTDQVHVHATSNALMDIQGVIDLTDALGADEICDNAPVFVMVTESDGALTGEVVEVEIQTDGKTLRATTTPSAQKSVFVDYYVVKAGSNVSELQIDGENFAGYYYVEASTLFRRQADGVDMPAELTFPNVKIQSNFTFQMASTGDPSTFTFTMDAFPGYTIFDPTKKVLCVMQIVEDASAANKTAKSVMTHKDDEGEFEFEDQMAAGEWTLTTVLSNDDDPEDVGITGATLASDSTAQAGQVFKWNALAGSGTGSWQLGATDVDIATDYKITVTGTPNDKDTITIKRVRA